MIAWLRDSNIGSSVELIFCCSFLYSFTKPSRRARSFAESRFPCAAALASSACISASRCSCAGEVTLNAFSVMISPLGPSFCVVSVDNSHPFRCTVLSSFPCSLTATARSSYTACKFSSVSAFNCAASAAFASSAGLYSVLPDIPPCGYALLPTMNPSFALTASSSLRAAARFAAAIFN